MTRNLLILACLLFISSLSFGQKKAKTPDLRLLTIPGTAALRPVKDPSSEVKFDYKQINAPLPSFDIFNHENKNISKEVLKHGGNLIVMIFNPVCDHCETQTRLFMDSISLFKKSKLLLIAAPIQSANLSYFESNVSFSKHSNTVTVSIDSAKVLDKIFNYIELPQLNIYDGKSLRLIKTFNSGAPLDSLRQYIQ